MVQKTFPIALDIKRPTANRDFEVVLGDNGNRLVVTLTDDGAAVDLSDCLVCAIFSKSDGNTAEQDTDGHGIIVSGNQLTISLYTTSVAPGLVECELQVYSEEGHSTLVTSAKFNFMCRSGIANDETIQTTDEWPLLVGALQRVEAAEEAEALRVTAEIGRVSNESERVSSESERISAESGRASAESSRATAETSRSTAESGRVTAESGRVAAENARVSSENVRIATEATRVTSEDTRVSQEAGRVSAEAARVTAENARVSRENAARVFEEYNNAKQYFLQNKVSYQGSSYICLAGTVGNPPPAEPYWLVIAEKGKDGTGTGDMEKTAYDTNNDGVVNDSDKLGGQLPSHYATTAHTHSAAQVGAAAAAVEFTATVDAYNWTGTGPWTQTITVAGITAAMVPFVDMYFAPGELSDANLLTNRLRCFGYIDRVVANNGSITVTCLSNKPEYHVSIRLRVVQ